MSKYRQEPTIGAWQYDDQGRRYRMVGSCKEYAMVMTTTHGDIYADDLKKHQKQWQEESEKPKPEKPKQIDKTCPIKNFHGGMSVNCVSDCAFYQDGCALGVADPRQTEGKFCPFMRKCSDRCALYQSGCTMKFQ